MSQLGELLQVVHVMLCEVAPTQREPATMRSTMLEPVQAEEASGATLSVSHAPVVLVTEPSGRAI